MEEYEVWKDINDFNNYEVSSYGSVRNKKTGRILKASNKGGYYNLALSNKNKKIFHCFVHRLVALAFLENPENKAHVNHKDKNGLNNNLTNLEWSTPEENNKHKSNGVIQTTNQNLGVWRVDLKTNERLEKYNSIDEGAKWVVSQDSTKKINSVKSSISCCTRGIYKTSYGFKWDIVEQNNLENEEWREVIIDDKKVEGYFVSSLGRFKNKKGIIMSNYKPHHSGYIYLRVNIKKYALHRLVALTFIDNPENKPFVNHIDGNKLNNAVTNLEWVTCAENNLHNHKIGLINTYTRKIIQYNLAMNEIAKFDSIKEACIKTGCSLSCIKDVLKEKQKNTKGFIFKYLD